MRRDSANVGHMENWHLWTIAGILLFIVEMVSFTGFAACFGVAALLTSIVAYLDKGLTTELAAFAITSTACMAAVRPIFRSIYRHSDDRPILTDSIPGQHGVVIDEIEPAGMGRVKLGGEEWRAQTPDGSGIAAGAHVTITAIQGATLTVIPREA